MQFGARPVTYVPTRSDDAHSSRGGGSALLSSLEASFRGLISQLADENVTGAGGTMNPTKTPTTPTEAIEHLERTLALEVLAFVKPYDSLLDQADPRYYYSEREWRKFGNMRFDPTDVTRVVVRPEFVACARQDFPELSSRIFASPS